MTFADEADKRSNERATLVRMTPGRHVSIDELETPGGPNLYELITDLQVVAVQRNGVDLAWTDSSSPGSNNLYNFDESTGTLRFNVNSTPNSTSNVIVIFFNIYYTSGIQVAFPEDPSDPDAELRHWKPRLQRGADIASSLRGNEVGVLTIADSRIDINNADGDFSKYLGAKFSFFNKAIKIWHVVNGQVDFAYGGKILNMPYGSVDGISISFSDQVQLLDQTAFMGDTFAQCFHNTSATPKDNMLPIPLHLSETTWQQTDALVAYGGTLALMQRGLRAICSSYSANLSTSTNRTWTLARTLGSLKTQSFGTLQAVANDSGFFYMFRFSSYSNVNYGDTISWTTSGTTYYGIAIGIGSFTYSGNPYNLIVQSSGHAGTLTTSSTMNAKASMMLQMVDQDGSMVYPLQTLHYSVSQTDTDGGHKLIKITFANNMEASIPCTSPLDPNRVDLQYRLDVSATFLHSTVLKRMMDKAGIVTNSASFTAAGAALTDDTAFSIPFMGETSYSKYISYAQKLLESTLGYLKQNSADEMEYRLLAAPSPTESRDDNTNLGSGVAIGVEYRDIITEVTPTNPHLPVISTGTPDGTTSSNLAKHLHGVTQNYRLEHVLKADSNGQIGRQAAILSYRSNRRMTFQYQTASMDLSTKIGDAHEVSSDQIPDGEVSGMVVSLVKSEEETSVAATDVLGL